MSDQPFCSYAFGSAQMQTTDFTAILQSLQSGKDLSSTQMCGVIAWFLTGEAQPDSMHAFLVSLAEKGETVDELVGAARALRQSMVPIRAARTPIVDTCGTGGDGTKTFNISTAAALAIASCGVSVAKHGNRKITSATGSADVLAELGINLEAAPVVVEDCLRDLGICFCFAPLFHPAMRHVGPTRRAIAHPTIFNRLGPLANPARADRQVLGVGSQELQMPMAQALQMLGSQRSLVVRGQDGVDEISLSGPTRVLEVTADAISEHTWEPGDFGVAAAGRESLFAEDPVASAACIRAVFDGELGPRRDVVVLNAAAGLWIAGVDRNLKDCARLVGEAIDSGKTRRLLSELGAATHRTSSHGNS